MATPEEINEIVIKQLRALYKPEKNPEIYPEDYARMVGLYVQSLTDYTPEVLELGMDLCRREWTFMGWPVPGKIREWMCEAERQIKPETNWPAIAYYRPPPMTSPAIPSVWMTRWREIMKTGEIGRWTAEEGLHYCKTGERPGAPIPDSIRADLAKARKHGAVIKAKQDSYHIRAIAEIVGRKPQAEWTPAEFKAISVRQAELRTELGL